MAGGEPGAPPAAKGTQSFPGGRSEGAGRAGAGPGRLLRCAPSAIRPRCDGDAAGKSPCRAGHPLSLLCCSFPLWEWQGKSSRSVCLSFLGRENRAPSSCRLHGAPLCSSAAPGVFRVVLVLLSEGSWDLFYFFSTLSGFMRSIYYYFFFPPVGLARESNCASAWACLSNVGICEVICSGAKRWKEHFHFCLGTPSKCSEAGLGLNNGLNKGKLRPERFGEHEGNVLSWMLGHGWCPQDCIPSSLLEFCTAMEGSAWLGSSSSPEDLAGKRGNCDGEQE